MSEITATLTKKIGPLPAWSYAAIGGAVGLYMILHKKSVPVQAAVGTGTLPVQPIGSGSGGGGDGGTTTTTPTPTPTPPSIYDNTAPRFSQDQYNQLSTMYEQAVAQLMNLENGIGTTSPITPAPSNPTLIPPQITYVNPTGPAGPVPYYGNRETPSPYDTPSYAPAYNPSYQMPNPPLLHYIGGPLNGMNLPAQVASALSP